MNLDFEGLVFMTIGFGMLAWKLYVWIQISKELEKWGFDKEERRKFH